MSKHLLAFLLSALAWLVASNVKAQTTGAAISTKKVEASNSVKEKPLSLSVDLSGTSNLEKSDSAESDQSTNLDLILNYKINKDYELAVRQIISHSNNGIYLVEATNTLLIAKLKSYKLTDNTKIRPELKAYLPTNEEDREYDSLRGAAAAKLGLSTKTKMGAPVTAGLSGELLKNAHEFESNAGDKANLSYRFRTSGSLAFEVTDSFSLSVAAYYQAGKTYQDALRTGYYFAQEASYNIAKKSSLYLLHENGGDPREANGTDIDINVTDDRTSTISLGFRTIF